jgi:hypothetical protein|nr:MAG TPA: hypothetical protein [Crassvirales sp.]
MKLTIDEDACKKVNLSLPEVLMITLVKTGVNIETLVKQMKEKQILVEEHTLLGINLLVTQRWSDLSDKALLSADKSVPDNKRLETLAKALMEVFPAGKKDGTSQYWKGNLRDNTLRLAKFFKLYGDKYTDEQLIEAAKNYVSSHNGRYQYMRVLKYFIWKDTRKVNSEGEGYIEEVSDLAAFIENAKDEQDLKDDWVSNMI